MPGKEREKREEWTGWQIFVLYQQKDLLISAAVIEFWKVLVKILIAWLVPHWPLIDLSLTGSWFLKMRRKPLAGKMRIESSRKNTSIERTVEALGLYENIGEIFKN